jgi:hypothetical protein
MVALAIAAAALAGCSEERVTVPDLVGLSQEEAEDALTDAALKLGEVEHELVAGSSERLGTVLSQLPSAGTEVDAESQVALVVVEAAEETSDEETETPPAANGGSTADDGSSDDDSAVDEGSTSDDDPAVDEGATDGIIHHPGARVAYYWHTLAEASGSGDYGPRSPFTITAARVQLTITVSSTSGSDVGFELFAESRRTVSFFATTAMPTTHERDLSHLDGTYRAGIDAPSSCQWSFALREWRAAGSD